MKRQKDVTLKDERSVVIDARLASIRRERDALVETYGDGLLGNKKKSNSIPAISGGRPESNRRKF